MNVNTRFHAVSLHTQFIHDSKKEKKWPTEKFEMEKNSKKVEVNFCVQNYFHARTSLSVMV